MIEKGSTFVNAMVHTPICCPSRSSFLSGRYLHNSLTFQNAAADGCANISWANGPEADSYAVHAKASGYHTHYAGKYLNAYGLPGSAHCSKIGDPGCLRTPPGWDDWHGLIGNSRYYNASIISNGVRHDYGQDTKTDYAPDLFFNRTMTFLQSHFQSQPENPFLAVLATPSCHGPFTPADKYIGIFKNSSAPRTPNFNASNEDKQWIMRHLSPITDSMVVGIDNQHNSRWETLLSVDDYVEAVINTITAYGQMDRTYFIYTSDHGFQLGQHRLPGDKRHPYDHDLRIPFIVRGPGVSVGSQNTNIVLNIDVAPTFAEIVSGSVPDTMDGTSFLPLLSGKASPTWRSDFMVEYHGQYKGCGLEQCPPPPFSDFHCIDGKNNTYQCVRTLTASTGENDSLYCEFVDDEHFVEYYDHKTDPWQMTNTINTTSSVKISAIRARLQSMRRCKGVGCRGL